MFTAISKLWEGRDGGGDGGRDLGMDGGRNYKLKCDTLHIYVRLKTLWENTVNSLFLHQFLIIFCTSKYAFIVHALTDIICCLITSIDDSININRSVKQGFSQPTTRLWIFNATIWKIYVQYTSAPLLCIRNNTISTWLANCLAPMLKHFWHTWKTLEWQCVFRELFHCYMDTHD